MYFHSVNRKLVFNPLAEAHWCLQAGQQVWRLGWDVQDELLRCTYRHGLQKRVARWTGNTNTSYSFVICVKIEKLHKNNRNLQ